MRTFSAPILRGSVSNNSEERVCVCSTGYLIYFASIILSLDGIDSVSCRHPRERTSARSGSGGGQCRVAGLPGPVGHHPLARHTALVPECRACCLPHGPAAVAALPKRESGTGEAPHSMTQGTGFRTHNRGHSTGHAAVACC